MKDASMLHPLARKNCKSGRITFIHKGEQHTVTTCINQLTGDRMTWWDDKCPTVGDSLAWIKGTFANIRERCTVVKVTGDF